MTTVTVNVPEKPQATVDIIGLPVDVAIVFCTLIGKYPTHISGDVQFFKHWSELSDAIEEYENEDKDLRAFHRDLSHRAFKYMKEYK